MSEIEIALTRAYLTAAEQDPIAALIRSVKDLARIRRMMATSDQRPTVSDGPAPDATLRSLRALEAGTVG